MISEDHDHATAISQVIESPTPYCEHDSSELVSIYCQVTCDPYKIYISLLFSINSKS